MNIQEVSIVRVNGSIYAAVTLQDPYYGYKRTMLYAIKYKEGVPICKAGGHAINLTNLLQQFSVKEEYEQTCREFYKKWGNKL